MLCILSGALFLQVSCLAAVIPAGLALSYDKTTNANKDHLRTAGGGVALGAAVVAMATEICFVVLRFLNIGVLNYQIRWFLIVVSR